MADMEKHDPLAKGLTKLYESLSAVRDTLMGPKLEAMSWMRHRSGYTDSQVKKRTIHDDTSIMAMETFVDGVMAYLITEGKDWFKFLTWIKNNPSDRIYGANDYLEASQKCVLALMSRTRFYSSIRTVVKDSYISGNGYLFTADDQDTKNIFFMAIDPQEVVGDVDENGTPIIIIRKFCMTGRAAYKKWGSALPQSLIEKIRKGSGGQKFDFLDAYYPREEILDDKGDPIVTTFKNIAHTVFSYEGSEVIEKNGYDEMPISVFRYHHIEGSFYGEGHVEKFIDEVKKLDDMCNQRQILFQKNANPAYNLALAMADKRWSDNPGARNFVPSMQEQPQPVARATDASYLLNNIEYQKEIIMDMFNAKLFRLLMMSDNTTKTAYEISERKGEALMLLSVAIGTMQMELVTPCVLRVFNILSRMGVIPPIPPELAKEAVGGLKVELDGPLVKRMQTYLQATGIVNGLAFITQVAQVSPDVIVNFDWDELARQGATSQGLPQTIIREFADVQKIKKEQLAQQQAMAQREQQLADTKKLAELSQAAGGMDQLAQYAGGI